MDRTPAAPGHDPARPAPARAFDAALERAEAFLETDGRLLERRLFERLFHEGPALPLIDALRAYQNLDGGFGSGLEPDLRDPASQPVAAEVALRTLDLGQALTRTEARPLLDALLAWLPRASVQGALPFVLPSARAHPRAPWWEPEDEPEPSLNPTAAVVGLLRKARVEHPWIARAQAWCWDALETFEPTEPHELACVSTFLQHVPDRARAGAVLERICAALPGSGLVAEDPDAEGYVFSPLAFAEAPDAPLRRCFDDDLLRRHLRARLAAQEEDGGWPVTWPTLSPAVTAAWRGRVTVGTLASLRAWERAGLLD